jgi:hypothetical protein
MNIAEIFIRRPVMTTMESFQQFMRKHFVCRAALEGETPLLTPPVEQPQSK